jgi:hypothetical protein
VVTGSKSGLWGTDMTPLEIENALARGEADPTLKALIGFVCDMSTLIVAESTGFWNARTCQEKRNLAAAEFIVAMEKAGADHEG